MTRGLILTINQLVKNKFNDDTATGDDAYPSNI